MASEQVTKLNQELENLRRQVAQLEAENARLLERLEQHQRIDRAVHDAVVGLLDLSMPIAGMGMGLDYLLRQLDPGHPLGEEVAVLKDLQADVMQRSRGLQRYLYLAIAAREPTLVNVTDIVAEMADELSKSSGDEIDVESRLCPDSCLVDVDYIELHTFALGELIANAREALEGDGKIILAVERKSINVETGDTEPPLKPGDYVVVSVSDTGLGIPQWDQPYVLHRYHTTKEGHVGLGLTKVWQFVEKYGGGIRFESEVSVGTTVEVYLPQAKGAADTITDTERPRPWKDVG